MSDDLDELLIGAPKPRRYPHWRDTKPGAPQGAPPVTPGITHHPGVAALLERGALPSEPRKPQPIDPDILELGAVILRADADRAARKAKAQPSQKIESKGAIFKLGDGRQAKVENGYLILV